MEVNLFRFGDQSLFVRRDVLRSAGGFDEALPVMEDQDMVRRLRRRVRFVILPRPVTTSAREYRRGGVYRMQLFVYPLVVALFHLGMPPRRLARTYRRLLDGR